MGDPTGTAFTGLKAIGTTGTDITGAFAGCTSLKTFGREGTNLPKAGLVEIISPAATDQIDVKDYSFNGCVAVSAVKIVADGAETYTGNIFSGCTGIKELTLDGAHGGDGSPLTFDFGAGKGIASVTNLIWNIATMIDDEADFAGLASLQKLTVIQKLTDVVGATTMFPVSTGFDTLELSTMDQNTDDNVFATLPATVKNVIIGTKDEANNFAAIIVGVPTSGTATQLFNSAVNYIKFTGAIHAQWSTFEELSNVTIEIVKGGPVAGTIPNDTFYHDNTVVAKLGKDVIDIGTNNFDPTRATNLQKYVVDGNNTAYGNNLDDGVLYGKKNGALDSLIRYPPKKTAPDRKYVIASSVKTIANGAFGANADLKDLTIPEGITSIGANALSALTGLEKVTYEAINAAAVTTGGVTEVFPSTLKEFTFGDKVNNVPTPFFKAATVGIEKIDIPENITFIGGDFTMLTGLTEVTFRAKRLNSPSLFYRSTGPVLMPKITKVTIGDKVDLIPASTFKGTGIMEVNLVKVGVVAESAFEECVSLNKVVVPYEFTSVGNSAFASCWSLRRVELLNTGVAMGLGCWLAYDGATVGLFDLKALYTSADGGEGVYGYAMNSAGTEYGWWKLN